MAARSRFRDAFDPDRTLVVMRALRVGGEDVPAGSIFDKTTVPLRRLRQMFDQRLLSYPEEDGRDRARPPAIRRPKLPEGNWSPGPERAAAAPSPTSPQREPLLTWEVRIPVHWREMRWSSILQLATKFSNVRIMNKLEAEAAIEAELKRRARAEAEAQAKAA